MKEKVTIVPEDKVMIVEGERLHLENLSSIGITEDVAFSLLHAIQWKNGTGHVEFKDGTVPNQSLSGEGDYGVWIAPFVNLWEVEKANLEATQAQTEAEALALYNSTETRASRVRIERDTRITACDWVISRHAEQMALGVDTTLTNDEYTEWLSYRQGLRDLPDLDGFPWSGGGEDDEGCPWPVEPS